MLDWRFFGQARLTAGLVRARNRVELTGRPAGGTFTFDGVEYDADELRRVRGEARFGKTATPYLGIGYGAVTANLDRLHAALRTMAQPGAEPGAAPSGIAESAVSRPVQPGTR